MDTNESKCPKCESARLVSGDFVPSPVADQVTNYFKPDGLGYVIFRTALSLSERPQVCLDCGFQWGGIDKDKLSSLIAKSGKADTKAKYGLA